MPVPSTIADLSTTPGSNSPAGSESPALMDDYLRTAFAFIKQLDNTKLAAIADGSISTAKIVDDAVTFAKLQNIATGRLLGRSTSGTGDVEELTLGPNLVLSGGVLNAVDGVPAGAVAMFARDTAPTGWLKCNGATLSRTTYAALWAAVNPATGGAGGVGDGTTTFTIPDLRGEFVRAWDDGRGVDSGRAIGSAQADELRSHSHTGGAYNTGQSANLGPNLGSYMNPSNTGATGGAETRPRNVALLACIKF